MKRTDLHEYQDFCVDFLKDHPEAMLILEMGLGKSAVSLTAILDLMFDSFEVNKVLVIAPLRVARNVWPEERETWEHASFLRMSVMVANRDFRKARDFCFNGSGMIPLRLEQAGRHLAGTDILIYGLPVRIDLVDNLPQRLRAVVEANYKDPCLKQVCAEAGIPYISGMDWLREQAVSGYRLMTDVEPDEERVKACCAQIL